jgi:hypothetical protein
MTFAELFATLASRGVFKKRAPAIKSSLRHLARALGAPTLELCEVSAACRDPAQWTAALATYLLTAGKKEGPVGAKNQSNIRNDLRVFFRLAEASGLLAAPLPPRLLKLSQRKAFEDKAGKASPYYETYRPKGRYRLIEADWPSDIQEGWHDYKDKCKGKIRPVTHEGYVRRLATFFGYLAHIRGLTPTWEALFEVDLLREFVRWHAKRVGSDADTSAHAAHTVHTVAAIAKVQGLEASRRQPLALYSSQLRLPPPIHDKEQYHMLPLKEIEAVADALIAEGRVKPILHSAPRHPGARKASRFQLGLLLKLMVRTPLRSRNLREIQLDKHLRHNKQTGEWSLRFVGKELKVATRKNKTNEHTVWLSRLYPADRDDFIPTLEEFLSVYRPLLPNGREGESPFLFLTCHGVPFSPRAIYEEVNVAVHRHTGVLFHPHMIRDIAATAILEREPNYDLVAALLGNTVHTVIKHYAHLIPEKLLAKASVHIGDILRKG